MKTTEQIYRKKFFTNDRVFNMINTTLIAIFVFMVLYPVFYTFSASISSGRAVDSGRVAFLPVELTFSAYQSVIQDTLFWRSYGNAIFITVFGTLFSMFISLTGAYALSKKDLPGHRLFNLLLVVTMWFSAGMIPMFINFQELGLLNSLWGLVIGFGVGAFNIVLLRGAFQGISNELFEAAKIDGANNLQIFARIALPSIKPTMVTVWVMYGISRWNGFFWAQIMLSDENRIPLQVYLRQLIVNREANMEFAMDISSVTHSHSTLIYAVIVVSMIPILLVFPYIQRFFKKGLMDGGVKE